jgi:hypothetical protein
MQTAVMNPKFSIREVGKLIKGSKKVFSWEFLMEGTPIRVEFFHSRKSNKRRLNVNGNKVLETTDKSNEFKYDLTVKGKKLTVIQISPAMFDLVIDGQLFSRLSEGDKPSPEASVKPVVEEQPTPCEVNNVVADQNRQTIMESIWGENVPTLSASHGPTVSGKTETKEGTTEETKDCIGYDFVKVPIRSHSALNLLLFEPTAGQGKKQLGDLLSEIDFCAKGVNNMMMDVKQTPQLQKHSDVIFINI